MKPDRVVIGGVPTNSLGDTVAQSLNKVYRAVHDGVCPECAHNMEAVEGGALHKCTSARCGLTISSDEMLAMREAVRLYFVKPMADFRWWQACRKAWEIK